ncbi:MAG: hypothetical protein H0T73_11350 [Ardenticatenales bacterium]|nr:hypothetical protein [Ardenticatenales bacterium]
MIERLLAPFRIKGLARILQNSALSAAEVRGWIYRGQEEADAAQMGGYLFRRLTAPPSEGEVLPALHRLAGEVNERESTLFENWWAQELAPPPFEDSSQRERYAAWLIVVKREAGNPERPDYSPHACWRREMARARV